METKKEVNLASMSKEEQDKYVRYKQMEYYLGWFFLKPNTNGAYQELVKKIVSDETTCQGFVFSNTDAVRRFGQAILLSYGRRVNWKVINTYELEEQSFQQVPVVSDNLDYEVLFITYTGQEFKNAQLYSAANSVINARNLHKKRTYILATKDTSGFPIKLTVFHGGSGVSSSKEVL